MGEPTLEAFLEQSDKAANVDVTKLGLVGHSRGARDVDNYTGGWRVPSVGARVVLGPTTGSGGVQNLGSPSLTIASDEDGSEAYDQAQAPRHLVLFTGQWIGYSHFSYFDGLCHDGNGNGSSETAPLQRSVTRRAIRAFLDHYLLGEPLQADLGIDEEDVTTEYAPENG